MFVSRTRRFIGLLINALTFNGLIIGNVILGMTSGRTVGGLVARYKYSEGGGKALMVFLLRAFVMPVLYFCTLTIMWWVEIIGLKRRNGTFSEKWANNPKVDL